VLDTSSTYVRGEENLQGWRPRGDSLILDHQWELEKLTRLELVEKARHILLLREKLSEQNKTQELTKLDKQASNISKQQASLLKMRERGDIGRDGDVDEASACPESEYDRDKELTSRCLKLLLAGRQSSGKMMENSLTESTSSGADGKDLCDNSAPGGTTETDKLATSVSSSSTSDSLNRPLSPDHKRCISSDSLSAAANGDLAAMQKIIPVHHDDSDQGEPLFAPEVEEIRVSPVVSRKGYLNFLEEGTNGWRKRFVVVRRPYVYIYNTEKDPVESGLINLATAPVEFSEESQAMIKARNTFSVITKHRGFLLQTLDDKDIYEWLYAINPLLAGQIRSTLSRRKRGAVQI